MAEGERMRSGMVPGRGSLYEILSSHQEGDHYIRFFPCLINGCTHEEQIAYQKLSLIEKVKERNKIIRLQNANGFSRNCEYARLPINVLVLLRECVYKMANGMAHLRNRETEGRFVADQQSIASSRCRIRVRLDSPLVESYFAR